ncbi:MAG: hypothetical protein DRP79_00700 [Planctomycetota bacterium]|nr:MAG: hypothetical protein DRP79_00700 [Planctomycetota bacterium]
MLNLNQPLLSEKILGQKLTPRQRGIIDRVADWTVRRGMTTPAILCLESVKPLSYVGSQVVVFFAPALEVLFDPVSISAFVSLMEDRNNVELLLREIESRDAEQQKKEKELKAQRRAMKRQRKLMRKMKKAAKKGGA